MASNEAKKLAEEALDKLSAALEAGHSEALKAYLGAMGRFHRYSWGNVLLIASQRPDATHVAGYHTWHDLGRFVKKGEKGITIFAPILVKHTPTSLEQLQDRESDVFRLTGFRAAYVFDIEQTEGKPLPAFATSKGDPRDATERLKDLVARKGIPLEYDGSIAPALGMSSGGRIRLVPGLSAAEEFSVLTHELAHEMLHHHEDRPSLPKVVRETQAEAVAFVVSRAVGLETNTAAADYIALYNGDKKTLAESLATIQETAGRILDDVLPEERLTADPEKTASGTPESRSRPFGRSESARPGPPADSNARSDRHCFLGPLAPLGEDFRVTGHLRNRSRGYRTPEVAQLLPGLKEQAGPS
jgi:antirestriction protein ArdC